MKKRNKLWRMGWIALFILIFIIGILVGKLISVPGISVAKEINPLHGISILCSVFIAIYIALILDKHKECKKNQKELILRRVEDLHSQINSVNGKLDNNPVSYYDATSITKTLWTLFESVRKLICISNISLKSDYEKSFKEKHRDLKDLMTNTPIIPEEINNPPIKVEGGIVKYNKVRIQEIEACIESLKSCIYELQITIINH